MAKKTQIERAIDGLDREIAILQEAKTRLAEQQRQLKPRARKPRVVAAVADRSA